MNSLSLEPPPDVDRRMGFRVSIFSGRLRRMPVRSRLLVAAAIAALVGLASFAVDLTVAAWFKARNGQVLPGDLSRIVALAEVFGYSLSAALIAAAAVMLDPTLRGRVLGRFVAAAFAGGIVVDLIKVTIPRIRPRAADLAAHASAATSFAVERFVAEGGGGADIKSFPSGHSAMAAGLTAALCWRYPRGCPLFVAIGLLAGLQRLTSSAHYPSDVAIGAAIGLAMAALFMGGGESRMHSSSEPLSPDAVCPGVSNTNGPSKTSEKSVGGADTAAH